MEEKYGIELDLIMSAFNKKIQQIQNKLKSIEKVKINIETNTIKNETEKIHKQTESIKNIFDPNDISGMKIHWNDVSEDAGGYLDTVNKIRSAEKTIGSIQYDSKSIQNFVDGYGEIDKQVKETEKDTANLNKEIQKTGNMKIFNKVVQNNTKSFNKGLDKLTSKIKKVGLSLLSIRSIYSLVSKASSAYLSQDIELANRLQSAWIGLGAILSPIINFITTLILKLVSVINNFIKALTGVDLIAKASAKSLKNASNGANALKKSLAGFDELTNLDGNTSSAGVGGILDSFATIDTDWSNMIENIYKTTDRFKTNIVKRMKESVESAKDVFRTAGLSNDFIDMYDFAANGSIDVLEGFIESFKGIISILDGILNGDKDKIIEGFKQLGSSLWKILTGFIQFVVGAIGTLITGIENLIAAGARWIWNNVLSPVWNWIVDQLNGTKANMSLFINTIGNWFDGLWKGIKNGASNAWNWIVDQLNGTKANMSLFINTIGNWFNNLWKNLLKGFATVWNKIANTANKIGGAIGMTTLPTINSYAVGTNYVPEDQLAYIHKGEAIIPKKFNSQEYFSGSDDETKSLLQEIREAIKDIEINPYTTIKDVGKTAVNYINSKNRQLGGSVIN